MADFIYDLGRESFLKGDFDLATDNVKVALVRIGGGHYVANSATDQFLSIISGGDIIATTANLSSKTTAAGVFAAADTVFTAVSAGPAGGALVMYKDTGTAGTSRLICYIDDYAGLPFTPNGSDINVTWPGAGIFKL